MLEVLILIFGGNCLLWIIETSAPVSISIWKIKFLQLGNRILRRCSSWPSLPLVLQVRCLYSRFQCVWFLCHEFLKVLLLAFGNHFCFSFSALRSHRYLWCGLDPYSICRKFCFLGLFSPAQVERSKWKLQLSCGILVLRVLCSYNRNTS